MEKMVNAFEELKKTFSNKKVFLTGHTGFKGTWMMLVLKELGADIKGFSLKPDVPSLFSLTGGENHCNSETGDIRNFEVLNNSIQSFQPDFIFHLAAQALVRDSYEQPVYTFETNFNGTLHVLQSLISLKKKCSSVFITTDKVYENLETERHFREEDKLGGHDPYSASKACAEILIDSYRKSFFNFYELERHQKLIVSARAGNVIGGGDWSRDRIIPDFIRSVELEKPLEIRNPFSKRPWQHVLEPTLAYLWIGKKLSEDPSGISHSYNIGPNPEDISTVKELIDEAIKILGKGKYELKPDPHALHEAGILKLDISKAIKELEWKPVYNSRKAIELTLDWYKNYRKDPLMITRNQIKNFFSGIC